MNTANFSEVLQSIERQLETLLASDLSKQDAFSLTEARFHTRAARSRFKATSSDIHSIDPKTVPQIRP